MENQNGLRIKASPLARRIAEEHNIDLRQIQGTGPGGRIVRDDLGSHIERQTTTSAPAAAAVQTIPETPPQVAQAAPSLPANAPDDEVIDPTQMQKTVARRLTESKTTVPHFYVT